MLINYLLVTISNKSCNLTIFLPDDALEINFVGNWDCNIIPKVCFGKDLILSIHISCSPTYFCSYTISFINICFKIFHKGEVFNPSTRISKWKCNEKGSYNTKNVANLNNKGVHCLMKNFQSHSTWMTNMHRSWSIMRLFHKTAHSLTGPTITSFIWCHKTTIQLQQC